ncbi:MAG: YciI family protein [Actinomycetota bacterium]|nr:YciI family protein [Actinomycetota bacterium]
MSQYLVLIYGEEAAFAAGGADLQESVMKGHMAFGEKYGSTIAGGNALQGSDTATSIRPDGSGGFTVTDGPFLETKEILGGYYLIEAANLDEAIATAKEIPAPAGGLEVRPIMVFDS